MWDRPDDEEYYVGLQETYYWHYGSAYEYGESYDYDSCFVINIYGDYETMDHCDDELRSVCEKPKGKIAIIL